MKKYAKLYSESLDGRVGKCYYEVVDSLVARQVDVFDGDYYWADKNGFNNEKYGFTDQPEWDEEQDSKLDEYEEISEREFEQIWKIAQSKKY